MNQHEEIRELEEYINLILTVARLMGLEAKKESNTYVIKKNKKHYWSFSLLLDTLLVITDKYHIQKYYIHETHEEKINRLKKILEELNGDLIDK